MGNEPGAAMSDSSVKRMFLIITMVDSWKELTPQINSIPWRIIAPHDAQAIRNHAGQNLENLASRGGLSPCEAVAVLEDVDYRKRWPKQILSQEQMVAHNTEAINRLRELCLGIEFKV